MEYEYVCWECGNKYGTVKRERTNLIPRYIQECDICKRIRPVFEFDVLFGHICENAGEMIIRDKKIRRCLEL
jgi:predicted nucleic acid-binding Zn ribbon protein